MRLIDADALYRKVKAECNPYGNPSIGWEDGKKVMEWIEHAPTISGWTSVKDEMPELEGDYWVTDGYHVPWKCRLLKLAGVKGWANDVSNPVINYWMPLPEQWEAVK